jgi:uncharacterized membrane protein YeaQ/YmgE (transglycosylase-associated protein family)
MHGIVYWLIVGLIAGWLTGKLMGGGGKGVLMDIVAGIAGGIAGGFLMQLVGFSAAGGFVYNVIVAVIGAALLTWLYRKIVKS